MTTETTPSMADLRKALADAEANAKTAAAKVAENKARDKEWIVDNLDQMQADNGALKRANNAVEAAKEAIATFEVNEKFKVMEPVLASIRTTVGNLVKAGLPSPTPASFDIEVKLNDDGGIDVTPIVRYNQPDLDKIKATVAEAMAGHRELMRTSGFRELEGKAANIGLPSLQVSSGRLFKAAPKATGTRTASPSTGGDFKAGQTLTGKSHDKTFTCRVVAKGDGVVFVMDGVEYGSASGAAKAATGVSTNGNKFWHAA